ncbi:XRE family transcriptional regulator [Bacillus atrophaeus]|uniref:helix-turn-helix domain-containing protein n=1 Tax=Bacillus atrophaeus TaxID=1452 RepID=UPI000D049509|nr:helix-turn-helix domain-containing protein [Bacillus atrophaeus]MBT2626132.1 helix-turn-helix transcriptional regulator [Bacillus sp. ISL-32]MEC0935462.1 helix-turn-helix transcriptional regulator [Bacillus atrophaeus]PSA91530.1 XRE family transcriptional regulator [Bacillus atrophaeus]
MKQLNLIFIKSRRKELRITLLEMGKQLGLKTGSSYLKYEQGVYAFRAEQLPILAQNLQCEIADFFAENVSDLETSSA